MTPGLWVVLAAAVAVVVLALLVASLASASRRRRRLEEALAESRAELATMRHRLDALTRQVAGGPVDDPAEVGQTQYVITTAGEMSRADSPAADVPEVQVPGREFVSVAASESLVRLVSLGYGVRRALSAENRNRIGFEMRREVRRTRRQRRREEKQARRYLREVAQDTAA